MQKNGNTGSYVLATMVAALILLAGFQYVNFRKFKETLVAQNAAVELLRQFDARLQGQLKAYSDENASMRKQLEELRTGRGEIDRLNSAQQAELDEYKSKHQAQLELIKKLEEQVDKIEDSDRLGEPKVSTINLFAAKGTYGQNVFIGKDAGPRAGAFAEDGEEKREVGSFNTSLGVSSLARNRTGALNAAIGASALASNVEGNNNLAAGANALAWNDTGSANVAVGSAALYRNIGGGHNSAVGTQALYNLEYGSNNSAFGRDALFSTKRGSWNSAFGVDSLPGLEVGEGNSAFGGESGYTEDRDAQHRLGSFNSWFGFQSGPATIKQVSNSIAIGYRAKNTESDQTVIGNPTTKEAIIFGALKIDRLCVGKVCLDEKSLEEMRRTRQK